VLACLSAFYDWNWDEAKKIFQRVFELHPNPCTCSLLVIAIIYPFVEGKSEEGSKEARKAARTTGTFGINISSCFISHLYDCK
jgi:hypothetical protein